MARIDARRLAVVDQHNDSVKIIDVEKHIVVDHIKLPGTPVAIACIDETQLVVACHGRTLLFLRLDCTLREVNKVELENRPFGVVSLNGEIGILFKRPEPCFKILSLSGETKRTCIWPGLRCETHIGTNISKTRLFVSDIDAYCIRVKDLTGDGQKLPIFRTIELPLLFKQPSNLTWKPYPTCLTVDQNDNVYVADEASGCIVRITADGDITTLIDGQDLPPNPTSIEYCQSKNKLYVGFRGKNEILSFSLINRPLTTRSGCQHF